VAQSKPHRELPPNSIRAYERDGYSLPASGIYKFYEKTLHFPKQQCFGAIAHQILMKENGSRKSNCHAATSGLPERLRWSGRFAH
jgi:hypothetical protein